MRIFARIVLFAAIIAILPSAGGNTAEVTANPLEMAPGVYAEEGGVLFAVGVGRLTDALQEDRALRLAERLAVNDAKRRLAVFLFPEEFKRHKHISLEMKNARMTSRVGADKKTVTAAITVLDSDVLCVISPDESAILNAEDVVIEPEFLRYLAEYPLLQDGGAHLFSRDDGWLALGVGLAFLPNADDALTEHEARKIAQMEAGNALAGLLFGHHIQVLEQEATTVVERDGIARFKEWMRKETLETVNGVIHSAEVVGHWRTDDDHIAVVLAIGSSPIHAGTASPRQKVGFPDSFVDVDLQPPWDKILAGQLRLLKGGAILVVENDRGWVIGIGSAKLMGNPVHDRINAPRMAELDAQRQIAKYTVGFSSDSLVAQWEESTNTGITGASTTETRNDFLRKISKENLRASLGGVHCTRLFFRNSDVTYCCARNSLEIG